LIVQTDQANTWTTGVQTINTGAAGTVGLIVQANAGQTADLQQWQDSAGNTISLVDERGIVSSGRYPSVTNTMCGDDAGNLTLTGTHVVAVGNFAGNSVTSGLDEVFVGYEAGRYTTTAIGNVYVGSRAGRAGTTGNYNVAVGSYALYLNQTGIMNVAIGGLALRNNTASYNTAIGYFALYDCTTGEKNFAMGRSTLGNLTDGDENVGIGYEALQNLTTGNNNMAVGTSALAGLTTTSANVAIGRIAGSRCQGTGSVFVGYYTGYGAAAAAYDYNVAIGYEAGYNLAGDHNVFIGYQAGYNEGGSDRLYIANSNTASPLIYGEFDGGGNYGVRIHGPATGAVTLTAREIAAQTADVIRAEDSAGTVGFAVEADFDVVIGSGAAAKDYTLTFNGETNDGVLTWMEDEDRFDVADEMDFLDRVVHNTATLSAVGPTDNQAAAGINILFIDASGNNVTLGGFVNGVSGQAVHIVVTGINGATTVTVEHAEGTGNQDIYLSSGGDESLANSYGGWTVVCNGTHWYEVEQ
jgi:hypothetical protein